MPMNLSMRLRHIYKSSKHIYFFDDFIWMIRFILFHLLNVFFISTFFLLLTSVVVCRLWLTWNNCIISPSSILHNLLDDWCMIFYLGMNWNCINALTASLLSILGVHVVWFHLQFCMCLDVSIPLHQHIVKHMHPLSNKLCINLFIAHKFVRL